MSNPPFKLDMSFDEALKRFAQTKPEEMKMPDAAAPVSQWITVAKGKCQISPEEAAYWKSRPITDVEVALLKAETEFRASSRDILKVISAKFGKVPRVRSMSPVFGS